MQVHSRDTVKLCRWALVPVVMAVWLRVKEWKMHWPKLLFFLAVLGCLSTLLLTFSARITFLRPKTTHVRRKMTLATSWYFLENWHTWARSVMYMLILKTNLLCIANLLKQVYQVYFAISEQGIHALELRSYVLKSEIINITGKMEHPTFKRGGLKWNVPTLSV